MNMSGVAAVILKVMPESPSSDLEAIKEESRLKLEEKNAKNISFEEKEVAFGLKSITIKFAWPESQDTDIIENIISSINEVSSVQIEDYRRAFG